MSTSGHDGDTLAVQVVGVEGSVVVSMAGAVVVAERYVSVVFVDVIR